MKTQCKRLLIIAEALHSQNAGCSMNLLEYGNVCLVTLAMVRFPLSNSSFVSMSLCLLLCARTCRQNCRKSKTLGNFPSRCRRNSNFHGCVAGKSTACIDQKVYPKKTGQRSLSKQWVTGKLAVPTSFTASKPFNARQPRIICPL